MTRLYWVIQINAVTYMRYPSASEYIGLSVKRKIIVYLAEQTSTTLTELASRRLFWETLFHPACITMLKSPRPSLSEKKSRTVQFEFYQTEKH